MAAEIENIATPCAVVVAVTVIGPAPGAALDVVIEVPVMVSEMVVRG